MSGLYYIMARNMRRDSDLTGSSTDLSPRRILKLTYQEVAQDRGRSLIYLTAMFIFGIISVLIQINRYKT